MKIFAFIFMAALITCFMGCQPKHSSKNAHPSSEVSRNSAAQQTPPPTAAATPAVPLQTSSTAPQVVETNEYRYTVPADWIVEQKDPNVPNEKSAHAQTGSTRIFVEDRYKTDPLDEIVANYLSNDDDHKIEKKSFDTDNQLSGVKLIQKDNYTISIRYLFKLNTQKKLYTVNCETSNKDFAASEALFDSIVKTLIIK